MTSFQGEGYYEEVTYKYTYDKKKNPFSGALIYFYPEVNMVGGSLCKHNITKVDLTIMSAGESYNQVANIDYSYKDNYPISRRETDIFDEGVETGGLEEFEYVK